MSCFTWCNSLPRPGYPHFDHLSSAQKSRLLEIFLGGIGESLHDVVPNGAGKKHRLLRDCGPVDWQSMGWREKLGLERCHIIYDNWLIDESNMIFIYIYICYNWLMSQLNPCFCCPPRHGIFAIEILAVWKVDVDTEGLGCYTPFWSCSTSLGVYVRCSFHCISGLNTKSRTAMLICTCCKLNRLIGQGKQQKPPTRYTLGNFWSIPSPWITSH